MELTRSELKAAVRYECNMSDLMEAFDDDEDIFVQGGYEITLEDIRTALRNRKSWDVDLETFKKEWYLDMLVLLEDDTIRFPEWRNGSDWNGIPNQSSVLCTVADRLFGDDFFTGKYMEIDEPLLENVESEIQTFLENRAKLPQERVFTEWQKKAFFKRWCEEDALQSADDLYVELFKRIVEELCDDGDVEALEWMSYAYYGNGMYPYSQNWEKSMEYLLRWLEAEPSGQCANTLGYMYYYGRISDGAPDYEKAFKYFSIGAAAGYYESVYKMSDMFFHGYGVPRSEKLAEQILWRIYPKHIKLLVDGKFDNRFPDIAYRLGNIWRKQGSYDAAVDMYIQAQYGIRKRIETIDQYGDHSVAKRIDEALAETIPQSEMAVKRSTVLQAELEFILNMAMNGWRQMTMQVQKRGEEKYVVTFKLIPSEEGVMDEMYILLPGMHYCGHRKELQIQIEGATSFGNHYMEKPLVFDRVKAGIYFLNGEPVAKLQSLYSVIGI